MAVSELPAPLVDDTLALAAKLVVMVRRADQRSGGLINRPLLGTVGELAHALARLRIEAPDILEDPHERPAEDSCGEARRARWFSELEEGARDGPRC